MLQAVEIAQRRWRHAMTLGVGGLCVLRVPCARYRMENGKCNTPPHLRASASDKSISPFTVWQAVEIARRRWRHAMTLGVGISLHNRRHNGTKVIIITENSKYNYRQVLFFDNTGFNNRRVIEHTHLSYAKLKLY